MMERDKSILNESFGSLVNKQHAQQSILQQQFAKAGSKKKKKFEISKNELKDEDFDQIVVETSAVITRNMRVSQQNKLMDNQQQLDSSCVSVLKEDIDQHLDNQTEPPPLMSSRPVDASQPKRPMNAFMVWGQAIRRELHNKFSNVQNAVLSKALGRVWKKLDLTEKEPYLTRANIIKSNHKRDYPNYRYQPRRIQEKQRRMQQNNHLKQQQQQQKTRPSSNSVYQKSKRSARVITSVVSQILYNDNFSSASQSNLVVPVEENNTNTVISRLKRETYDGELWKQASMYTCDGSGGPSPESGFSARKSREHDDKFFRYDNHQNGNLGSMEYSLPPIELDGTNNTNQINETQNQVSIDDHHQTRLLYETTDDHLKRTSGTVICHVSNNLFLGQQQQHQQQLMCQNTNSLNIYNSNYRQQYQQELIQESTQQSDLNDFGQYRQLTGEQVQYYDVNSRYPNNHNNDQHDQHDHDHQQQPQLYLRQMNEFANSDNYGPYRNHAQAENYNTCRSHSDEICPV